ncbi:NUDIX hydrolase [Micromonospora halophytica]|uniref:ADP-ribose pyrophosphatase YjhB, NUDIX family n=1 Tax=Micromonospora halophytica TaxID=47864 RepID=A0A1C5HMR9_9ACTN|nr:NUDIX domain-containing protein [Micromonospora halophytica]SCG47207.1 ADP-ribose pyrophosphatase YjhB, NUDIX family [Micromonospora halophytica]
MRVEAEIRALVESITPLDGLEAAHRARCLDWLAGTDDIFRRAKPRTPPTHLVAYFLLRDAEDGSVLLVDHRNAGLWLPTGGHVEPGEHPAETVRREVVEELGVPAEPDGPPFFLTVTPTVGPPEQRHVDVSLWYLIDGRRGQPLTPDPGEFRAARWWTPAEVAAAGPGTLDPHLPRALAKLAAG